MVTHNLFDTLLVQLITHISNIYIRSKCWRLCAPPSHDAVSLGTCLERVCPLPPISPVAFCFQVIT